MKLRNNKKGFTLIELVLVIVIIGILAAAALPQFVDLSGNARNSTVEQTAAAMRTSVATYIARNSDAPDTIAEMTGDGVFTVPAEWGVNADGVTLELTGFEATHNVVLTAGTGVVTANTP